MIRIIAGKLKGRRVSAPKNLIVRPTTDFAKEALFSILNHQYFFNEISALDLFAGIGSISYEFASRGCKDITTIEMNALQVRFIRETLEKLNIDEKVNLRKDNVLNFLEKNSAKKYDVIFADPPFDFLNEEYEKVINSIMTNNFLSDTGLFILEHDNKKDLSSYPGFFETRKYGSVSFSFFKNRDISL